MLKRFILLISLIILVVSCGFNVNKNVTSSTTGETDKPAGDNSPEEVGSITNTFSIVTPWVIVGEEENNTWTVTAVKQGDKFVLQKKSKKLVENIWKYIATNYNLAYTPDYPAGEFVAETPKAEFAENLDMLNYQYPEKIMKKYIGVAIVKVPESPTDEASEYKMVGKYTVAGIYETIESYPDEFARNIFDPLDNVTQAVGKDQYLVFRSDRVWKSKQGYSDYYAAHFIYDIYNPKYQNLENMNYAIDDRTVYFKKDTYNAQLGWAFRRIVE